MPIKYISITLIFLFFGIVPQTPVQASFTKEVHTLHHYHFSTPIGLESKVKFWKKIYSEYSTSHAVIHDMDNLDIIYEVAYLGGGSKNLSRRAKERKLERIKKKYQNLLLKIART